MFLRNPNARHYFYFPYLALDVFERGATVLVEDESYPAGDGRRVKLSRETSPRPGGMVWADPCVKLE